MNITPTVWAPHLTGVDLVTYQDGVEHRTKMTGSNREGWWEGPALEVGVDYAFAPEGGNAYPDPRTRWQPDGVDGPSRMWRPDPDHDWVPAPDKDALGAVFEEIHVGTFTPEGTLDAAADHLKHLADLGVDVVELMPVAQASGQFGWGYDGVDLFAVHQAMGGPDALVRFVDVAHTQGLLVALDVVLNHLGPWGNYLSQFAPYYSDENMTPWGPAFNLDGPGSHEPRQFLLDVVRWWMVDMHVDVIRLDAVHAIVDHSEKHLLAELAENVEVWRRQTGRNLRLVAESDLNQVRMVTPVTDGGMGMDMQWADDIHHALYVAITGDTSGYYADFADPDAVRKTLEDVFYHDGIFSTFRDKNWGARVPADHDRRDFVFYSQDHDQVGNRAQGDRPTAGRPDAVAAAAEALVLLAPFTPMLFQGEEWGSRTPFCYFSDQETADRATAVREGRRKEFADHGWTGEVPDPTDRATVALSTLDWSDLDTASAQRMLTWYRDLIALRHKTPSVTSGAKAQADMQDRTIYLKNGEIIVEANLDGAPLLELPQAIVQHFDLENTATKTLMSFAAAEDEALHTTSALADQASEALRLKNPAVRISRIA